MHTMNRLFMIGMLVGSVALAGCTASGEQIYSYDSANQGMAAGGANLADVHDTFESPGKARISFSIGGTGSADVSIKDGNGQSVYSKEIRGSGGSADSAEMSGAAGTWTIDIDFTNYQGGFALSITEA